MLQKKKEKEICFIQASINQSLRWAIWIFDVMILVLEHNARIFPGCTFYPPYANRLDCSWSREPVWAMEKPWHVGAIVAVLRFLSDRFSAAHPHERLEIVASVSRHRLLPSKYSVRRKTFFLLFSFRVYLGLQIVEKSPFFTVRFLCEINFGYVVSPWRRSRLK